MSEKKEVDFTKDKYWGKGGSYRVNPATGEREPVPAVVEADTAAPGSIPGEIAQGGGGQGIQIDGQGLAPVAGTDKPAADADTKTLKEKRRA
ncbi:MAG: hypothetical protein M0015_02935 [Betaproteobacteria bacterium]|nr:hypothetical protein [Betaproteobacteria bacterium]